MALSANVSASSEVTLKDIETFESLGGAGGDEAQEKSTAFLDGLAKRLLPIHAGLDLLFVEPNKETGFLKLADDITGDLEIKRGIADEDAPGGAVFFTMGFVHEIGSPGGAGWRLRHLWQSWALKSRGSVGTMRSALSTG